MIIFIQNFREHFKFWLLLLPLFTLTQSCSSHKSVDSEKTVLIEDSNAGTKNAIADSIGNKSPSPPRFLDTLRLQKMGITYQKIRSESYSDIWRLMLLDTVPKSEEIQTVTYQIVTYLDDNSSEVLSQLDSVFVQLLHKKQAFGFNGDGPYFHSYESLLKPNILFDDYNFDGLIDFSVQSGGSGTNESRYYYMFNPSMKYFNKPLSMANASFDKSNKLVNQSWHVSSAEGGKSTFKYTKADTLIMIKSEATVYLDSIESYVKEVRILQEDGSYSISLDTIKRY